MVRALDVGQTGREIWLIFFDAEDNGRLNGWNFGFAQQLIPQYKWTMIDGHMPFALRGIPVIDLSDFDYPYWHTT
jgi:hypothetical protein